jgi:hypothetical protein
MDSHKFRQIVDKELRQISQKNEDFINKNFKDGRKLEAFINLIAKIERSKLQNPAELEFYDDYHRVEKMWEDYDKFKESFEARYFAKQKELNMPVFVERHPVLRAKWIERWKEIVEPMFDLSESLLIPRADPNTEKYIDSKLTDESKELLSDTHKMIFDKQGIAIQLHDFDDKTKDDDNVKKAEIMGDILNKIANELEEGGQITGVSNELLAAKNQQSSLDSKRFTFVPGKIYESELARMLYVNNSNPEVYNLDFFTEYFAIDRKTLKTVLDYTSYPLLDYKKERVIKIMRFIHLD